MLSKLKSAKMVARWFVQQGILEQFNTAKEIQAGRLAIYALPGAGLLDMRLAHREAEAMVQKADKVKGIQR